MSDDTDTPKNETHIIASGLLLATLSTLVLILDIPPLIWHLRNRNTSATVLVLWILLLNFLNILNITIWPYTDYSTLWLGPGLCDIEVKILAAKTTGIPVAMLCLVRALAGVLDTEKTLLGPTETQRRRRLWLELGLCLGVPVATMVAHYLVQYNRYYIFGVSGCAVTIVRNWTAFAIMVMPPLLINLVAGYYAVLVLTRLRKYRHSFHTILASTTTTTTPSRYLRLFSISLLLLLGSLPTQLYILFTNLPSPQTPTSFSEIHDPAIWDVIPVGASRVIYDRWVSVACGVCVFGVFGLGADAVGMYRGWLVKMGLGVLFPWLVVDRVGSTRVLLGTKGSSGAWSRSKGSTLASVDVAVSKGQGVEDNIEGWSLPFRPLKAVLRRVDPRCYPHTRTSEEDSILELPLYHTTKVEREGIDSEVWSQVPLDGYHTQNQEVGGVTVKKQINRQSSGV